MQVVFSYVIMSPILKSWTIKSISILQSCVTDVLSEIGTKNKTESVLQNNVQMFNALIQKLTYYPVTPVKPTEGNSSTSSFHCPYPVFVQSLPNRLLAVAS